MFFCQTPFKLLDYHGPWKNPYTWELAITWMIFKKCNFIYIDEKRKYDDYIIQNNIPKYQRLHVDHPSWVMDRHV